jgi:hypothetical protein
MRLREKSCESLVVKFRKEYEKHREKTYGNSKMNPNIDR